MEHAQDANNPTLPGQEYSWSNLTNSDNCGNSGMSQDQNRKRLPLSNIFCEPVQTLDQDKGFIGQILRRLDSWILVEADRWDDPWKFLLGVRGVSKSDRDVFAAAQSQRIAAVRVVDLLASWGTVRGNPREAVIRAMAGGNKNKISKATAKFVRAMWKTQSQDIRINLDKTEPSSRGRADAERLLEVETKQLVRRHGSAWRDATTSEITNNDVIYNKLAVLLVRWWMRCGSGGSPGLMFFSNKALTELFSILLNDDKLEMNRVEQTRYRLGLKPSSNKTPLITGVIANDTEGKIIFQGRTWTFRDPVTGKITTGDATCRAQGGKITLCGFQLFPRP